ncbi:DegT/DnrJ/EryC1/StrS family aminotransferase [Labrys monachus]|uniref:dTDP-4-amino-4,6-dideoxygalactose transaminase n=1 Tax=Labrys monachus TaxID=217067 RepID=A0ABU0FH31_9HYPH|nr:DegT/DnrJ/EryC1/StrS family aminotransferase [Labrys monachus]MDQ0393434.1 dTDP-4-amino-4,6-dideoxygalactose transaminase [Labrys monachus]
MPAQLAIDGGSPAIGERLPSIRDASGRSLGAEEMEQLREVIESGSLSFLYGGKTQEFETAFAELYGVEHAVSVSSGTAALHTALLYLNPEPGDEVILSPITDMGTAIPILSQLAIPVFADVDRDTQAIDPRSIEEKITDRTRAIIVTHIYGNPADMDAIMAIAARHDLFVIEDCAQALLATDKGRLCGTMGDIGCFSFQQSKHMTTGDGGMVIAREDGRFGRRLRQCADKGWPRDQGGRNHLFLAPNYHMTELQAAVGLAQLRKLPGMVERRIHSAGQLTAALQGLDVEPVRIREGTTGTFFFYGFRLFPERLGVPVPQVMKALQAEGVDGFIGYPGPIPLYKYPVIRDHKTFGNSGWPFTLACARNWNYADAICPVAEQACRETVCMWWTEGFSQEQPQQIAAAIAKVLDAYRR